MRGLKELDRRLRRFERDIDAWRRQASRLAEPAAHGVQAQIESLLRRALALRAAIREALATAGDGLEETASSLVEDWRHLRRAAAAAAELVAGGDRTAHPAAGDDEPRSVGHTSSHTEGRRPRKGHGHPERS